MNAYSKYKAGVNLLAEYLRGNRPQVPNLSDGALDFAGVWDPTDYGVKVEFGRPVKETSIPIRWLDGQGTLGVVIIRADAGLQDAEQSINQPGRVYYEGDIVTRLICVLGSDAQMASLGQALQNDLQFDYTMGGNFTSIRSATLIDTQPETTGYGVLTSRMRVRVSENRTRGLIT